MAHRSAAPTAKSRKGLRGSAWLATLQERSGGLGDTHVTSSAKPASAPLPPLALRLLPAVLLVVGAVSEFRIWPDADVAWLLTVARMMADGARPYSRDIVEINPPLVMHLGQAAIEAGRLVGLDAVSAWRLVVCGFIAVSYALALPILTRLEDSGGRASAMPMCVLLAAVVACLPGSSFGQREHLIVLWLAPYVLCASLRMRGDPVDRFTASLAGVMLALALATKPHYLLVLLVELGILAARRRLSDLRRREVVVAAAFGAALLVVTLVTHPTYVSSGLRLAMDYYPDYGEGGVVWERLTALAIPLTVLAIAQVRRVPSVLCQTCTLAAAGCGLAAALQGKGWDYQFLPMVSFIVLATGAGCLALADAAVPRSLRTRAQLSTLVAVALVLVVAGLAERRTWRINHGQRQRSAGVLFSVLERTHQAGSPRSLSGLTLDLFPTFPVTEMLHAGWASRFSCLWMIPAIEARERAGGAGADPARSGRTDLETAVVEDLVERRPTLVIIEENRSRLLDQIVAHPSVQAVLRAYEHVGTVGTFQVWVRRPHPTT